MFKAFHRSVVFSRARKLSRSAVVGATLVFLSAGNAAAYGTLKGTFDGITSPDGTGSVYLYGWACETGLANSIGVKVFATTPSGTKTPVLSASTSTANEAAVDGACGVAAGAPHRFWIQFTPDMLAAYGGDTLSIDAVSPDGAPETTVFSSSASKVLPAMDIPVYAFVDKAAWEGTNFVLYGWACQKTVKQNIKVNLFTGSVGSMKLYSTTTTAMSRPDVTAVCANGLANNGFRIVVPKADVARLHGQGLFVYGVHLLGNVADGLGQYNGKLALPAGIPYNLSELALSGKDLDVPAGAVVTIDGNYDLGAITVEGVLQCPASGNFTIKTTMIDVMGPGALLQCGTSTTPFTGKLTIALKPGKVMNGCSAPHNPCSDRNFMVMNGGTLRLIGDITNARWVKLVRNAAPGDTTLTVSRAVGWKPGDELALASTDFDYTHAENLHVASVNGQVVTLTSPIRFAHYGKVQHPQGTKTWTLDERAEVADLTRSIAITSDNYAAITDNKGGHVMIMPSGHAYVNSVEFDHLGRMGDMARYPFHWHRAGNVTGQFIANSAIKHSYQRCVTVHGTDNAWVIGNVCFDHFSHGFFLEDGDEVGNHIVANLGMLTKRPPHGQQIRQSDIDLSSSSRFPGPATFWISNPNNDVRLNVAAGSVGTGIWNSFVDQISCDYAAQPVSHCQQPDSTHVANVFPTKTNTLIFQNNTAHSNAVGINWDGAEQGPLLNNPLNPADRAVGVVNYSPPAIPVFSNLLMYKNNQNANYIRSNEVQFDNLISADNRNGLLVNFDQLVTNSAIIATSDNFSPAELANIGYNIWGVTLYDGPMHLQNIDFINFNPQAISFNGISMHTIPFQIGGSSGRFTDYVEQLHFYPEPNLRVNLQCIGPCGFETPYSLAIKDLDGSLTGVAGAVMVPAVGYNSDPTCIADPHNPTALLCNDHRGNFKFVFQDANHNYEIDLPFVPARSDGQVAVPTEWNGQPNYTGNVKVGVVLGQGYQYRADFAAITQPTYTTPSSKLVTFSADTVAESPVLHIRNLGNNCRLSQGYAPNQPVAVASLDALQTVNGYDAYYSTGTELYIRAFPLLDMTPTAPVAKEYYSYFRQIDCF